MFLEAEIKKDRGSNYWAAGIEALQVFTQGESQDDALEMLKDAVETLWPDLKFDLDWSDREGGIAFLKTDDISNVVSKIIRQNRLEENLTQEQVAARLGSLYKSSVAPYESGDREPSIKKFDELLSAFGKTLVISIKDVKKDKAS